MNFIDHLFLTSAILGFLISLALISRVFTSQKADFFLGIVVLILAVELLFSWGSRTGFNNSPHTWPYWLLLNYLAIPPSIWLFTKAKTDDNFQFKTIHLLLFLPAFISLFLDVWGQITHHSLIQYALWPIFTQYLPLVGLILVLINFWKVYFIQNKRIQVVRRKRNRIPQLKLLLLMMSLSLVCLLWLVFEFIGFAHYEWIEYTFIFLFLGVSFFTFLESQTLPSLEIEEKNREFPHLNDKECLELLEHEMLTHQYYLKPNLPLKELAVELNLPARYISFLINHYHKKNYKEYINQFRIDAFLNKANSKEKYFKTLLGLALESGFSSKSTFNQVFKNQYNMSPSDYLNNHAKS